ncbi:MAG: acetyltransferase [Chloroflexi bacterium]|nr:acetyltransferase [Chloroflexota bacterium]
MNSAVIIFGAGGHGKVVLDAARSKGIAVDFLVDDHPNAPELLGCRVVNPHDPAWIALKQFRFIVAVGDNCQRARIYQRLIEKGGEPINVVHAAATVSPTVRLGAGILVCAGVVINPEAAIGNDCIINTSASVDHDCTVGEHVHLCPGVRLGGNVTVGNKTLLGLGAVVLPGMKIGEACVVGAGAVVNRNLPAYVVAYGVPARVHRQLALQV